MKKKVQREQLLQWFLYSDLALGFQTGSFSDLETKKTVSGFDPWEDGKSH